MNRYTFQYICNTEKFSWETRCANECQAFENLVAYLKEQNHLDITMIEMRSYVVNHLTPSRYMHPIGELP